MKFQWAVWLLIYVAGNAAAADLSSPVGIWDGVQKSVTEFRVQGAALKTKPAVVGDSLTQFKSDGSLSTYEWLEAPGTWTALKKPRRGYRISYDLNVLNEKLDGSGYLETLKANFGLAAKQRFGSKDTPVIKGIRLVGYSNRGKFAPRSDMALTGTRKVTAEVVYVNPRNQRDATGKVIIKSSYRKIRAVAPSDCCTSDDPQVNLEQSNAFLDTNKTIPRVQKTDSGLQYMVLTEATDAAAKAPTATDKVEVSYIGTLPNGTIFDFSRPTATFSVGGVIAGWTEGLQLMKEGARYRFFIPPELAYGTLSPSPRIKPNSALVFDVQLRKVNP